MLGANLGVNPSLTIAALTEHAMSHIRSAKEPAWDAIGEACRLCASPSLPCNDKSYFDLVASIVRIWFALLISSGK